VTTAAERVSELADAELFTSTALHDFVIKVRDLCRDVAYILQFQADTLQASLATLPVVNGRYGAMSSRARARVVAWSLRSAAEAVQHAGKLTVKAWALFQKYYVSEQNKQTPAKKSFQVNA
jgi:hypothetical protein